MKHFTDGLCSLLGETGTDRYIDIYVC
jgi:hypothetical protein